MTNVLCDRHHGGLYRSMQLLAERLNWNLYTPVGREWATEGYWRFGQNQGITDALAEQYLVAHEGVWYGRFEGAELQSGHAVTYDPEFPAVPIAGITLWAARLLRWDLVIATLDDNQHGFARFAKEVGAQYVAQVGNTNQYVDWSLDPLALVSSEVPIRGRGVRYHQEMDPAITFRKPETANLRRISSFVNCFPGIRREHPYIGLAWDELRALLPECQWREYGIDGADGVLKPISVLATAMASSGWIYMDKPTGDGFGHVIHAAAAIGRPLIGHGWHYANKMAEPFWVDGVTCIDLDKHSVEEVAHILLDTSPEKHAAMCHAIRWTFAQQVHYDAEALMIREFLGAARGAEAELSMA